MRRSHLAAIVTLLILLAPRSEALRPHGGGDLYSLIREPPTIVLPAIDGSQPPLLPATHPGVAALIEEASGPWQVQVDLTNGLLRRALGTGVPLIPGTANDLQRSKVAPSLSELETIVRAFLGRHEGLLGSPVWSEWIVSNEGSQPVLSGDVRPLRFTRFVGGVPVEASQIQLVLNRGNLTYINATGLDPIAVATEPTVSDAASWAAIGSAAAAIGVDLAAATAVNPPALILMPHQERPQGPLSYRLVRRHTFRLPDRYETWQAGIDAHSGELIELRDANSYACALDPTMLQGRVRGGVRPAKASDPEEIRHMIYPLVIDDGVNKNADFNGYYFYSGLTAESRLQGSFFNIDCAGCSPNPPRANTSTNGIIDFGTGGNDQITNGFSTPADRTCFYHLNAARAMAAKWIDRPWMGTNVNADVNINDACNAFWDGNRVGFFRSGCTSICCENTGEIRDVMQHEWGHAMDTNDGVSPGDSAMGEAYGDHIALFIDHDSCIGQSFSPTGIDEGQFCRSIPGCSMTDTCDGVRNLDEKRVNGGVKTTGNIAGKCPAFPCSSPTPMGRQCHCESGIYGQAAFHLQMNFLTGRDYDTDAPLAAGNPAFSDRAAWLIHERTFFNAVTIQRSYAPSHLQSVGTGAYDAYMAVDDDDGNLANGTPHAEYINRAFEHHEIDENVQVPDSPNCTPPGDPSVTVQPLFGDVSGNAQVEVTWTDTNASFYVVLRNLKLTDVWLPVRNQVIDDRSSGTYTIYDEPVQIGETYNYTVIAAGADGCPSPGDSVQTLTVALPDPTGVLGSITDPNGDGDGTPEPGELVELRVDLTEAAGLVDLTNAAVELLSLDPEVTVTVPGPIAYGDVAASSTVLGPANFEIGISVGHGCNTPVPLIAAVTADNGCLLLPIAFQIPAAGCAPQPRAEAQPIAIQTTGDDLDGSCSDNDGRPDNGETVAVSVDVQNTGTLTATNVRVTLTSTNPNVAVTSTNPFVIPTLAAAATDVATFTIEATGAGCQETAVLLAEGNSDENLFPIARSITLTLEEDLVPASLDAGFESDFSGWTAAGWSRSTARANGGAWSAYAGPGSGHPCDNGSDGANDCSTLVSPPFVCGPACQLSLSNWYRLEDFGTEWWDRANVHVIETATATHSEIAPSSRPYDGGAGQNMSPLCHIQGQDGWAGGAGQSWAVANFDLSAFAGQEIQVEINYNSDSAAICEGIYVDDLAITDAFFRDCDALSCAAGPNIAVELCAPTDLCPASGGGDGVIDPMDEVTYEVTLRNIGSADAIDVRGDIAVSPNGTILSGGTIGGGSPQLDIAVGASAVHTVVVRADGLCGELLDVDVVNLRAGASTFADNLVLCDNLIGADAPAGTIRIEESPSPAPAIPEDLPTLSRAQTQTVPAALNSATLEIDVSHGRTADLQAWLTGPDPANFIVADGAINGSLDVTAFVTAEGAGDYTLVMFDSVDGEVGTLDRWALVLDHQAYQSCNPCDSGGCAAPTMSVAPSVPAVCANALMWFVAEFTDVGAGRFDYEWDFGDGATLLVTDPTARAYHRYEDGLPNHTVTFTATSLDGMGCDGSAQMNVATDTGQAPTGTIGNRLRAVRDGVAADLIWAGTTLVPRTFVVHKSFDKTKLEDTTAGIGSQPVLERVVDSEQARDAGALSVAPDLAFYEVHPMNSCRATVLP